MKWRNISSLVFVLSVVLETFFYTVCAASEPFHFDTLYPKSFCTKATEQCVHVWGAWDALLAEKNVSPVDSTCTIDRSIGQLVLAQRFLEAISKDEKKSLAEQVHYLSRVIGTLSERLPQLPHLDADRSACLKEWVEKIKTLVKQKLYQ